MLSTQIDTKNTVLKTVWMLASDEEVIPTPAVEQEFLNLFSTPLGTFYDDDKSPFL